MKSVVPHRRLALFCVSLLACAVVFAPACPGYSVLTHEEIIDLLWQQQITPLLLARFPNATAEDLKQAHAYAYGGSVIQDIGYYPFGNQVVSDFAHYVRTGDFVKAMLADAQTLDEYAFALGALSHYISDINGHPYINLAVGIAYPKLAQLYGPSVPYDVDNKAHIRIEFGFDVLQVAKGRYAPENYHDFIGFQVSASLLKRAFYLTYGFQLTDVMPGEQLAINTYRRSISNILPEMTKVALLVKGDELKREIPNFNRQHFLYHLSQADYRKSWGSGYKRPGAGAYFLAGLFKVLPKVGPLRAIDFKEPTAKTEDLYFKSVNQTIDRYGQELREVKGRDLPLSDIDLDTGNPTKRGEYPLADATYRELLDRLASSHLVGLDDALRNNIVNFYDGFGLPTATEDHRLDDCFAERWRKSWVELNEVRTWVLLDDADRARPPFEPQTATTAETSVVQSCGE